MAKKRLQKKKAKAAAARTEQKLAENSIPASDKKIEPAKIETQKTEPVKVETKKVDPVNLIKKSNQQK